MAAVGLRIEFEIAHLGELLKRAPRRQSDDVGLHLGRRLARRRLLPRHRLRPERRPSRTTRASALPAFDRLFERQNVLPDGPEREALMREAKNLLVAYMPYKAHVHPIDVDLSHAHVRHLIRHPFKSAWWHFTDIAPRR